MPGHGLTGGALVGVYFAIGLFTAASHALFMNVTDASLGATQFSAFMGPTNLCESLAGRGVGLLVAGAGYPVAFTVMAIASLAGWPLARALERSTGDDTATPPTGRA